MTDYDRFLREARALRGRFFHGTPIVAARAPAWADLLGGAAAYGGALALGWPLAASTFVALQPTPRPQIRILADGVEHQLPLDDLLAPDGSPRTYADAAQRIAARAPADAPWWGAALGAWVALLREEFAPIGGGARVLIQPAHGPGAPASWAAAVAQALVTAYDVRLPPRELALACGVALRLGATTDDRRPTTGDQRPTAHAEDLPDRDDRDRDESRPSSVARRPGDALGPLTSVLAAAHELALVHQQPAWHWGGLHLPAGAAIWAIRVGDGPAGGGAPTAAAAMAHHMIAEAAGLTPREADGHWGGYLANIGAAQFERRYRAGLPERITGADWLAQTGAALPIDPAATYPLRAVAALPIEEHLRARTAAALLRAAASKAQRGDDLLLVGELLDQSHWAQRAAGIGDAHGDALAELIGRAGPAQGLYGARTPAAACGATLVALGRAEAEETLRAIADAYAAASGLPVTISGGTAPGCSPAGAREI